MEHTAPHPAPNQAQRRAFLRSGGLLLTVVTTGAMLASRQARADDGLLSQASVHYQTMPHDGQHCSNCAYFIPGQAATATGNCRLVGGTIDPDGWCVRFSS